MECGARSPQLGSTLASDLRAPAGTNESFASPGGALPDPLATRAAEPARTGGATAVIAGVGVLLLAMGVGVLIGRTSSAGAKAATAPAQVVSVAEPGTPAATTPAPPVSSKTQSAPRSSTKHGSAKSSSSSKSGSGGVGETPNKPAPPSVAEHLRGGKGQSYEQKSKNLPNVISTG